MQKSLDCTPPYPTMIPIDC